VDALDLRLGYLQNDAPALEAQQNELGAHPVEFGIDEMAEEEDEEGRFMLFDQAGDEEVVQRSVEEDEAAKSAREEERQRVSFICI